jgi:predicted N-acetyltransferase YhbS
MTKSDIDAIISIDQMTFKDCLYSYEEIVDRINLDAYPIYVAEEEDQIIGFIAFMKVQTLHYSGIWTDLVAVHPDHICKGIGQALIHTGEKLAKELGADFKSALVREDNIGSAKAFEKEGYTWDGKGFRLYIKE